MPLVVRGKLANSAPFLERARQIWRPQSQRCPVRAVRELREVQVATGIYFEEDRPCSVSATPQDWVRIPANTAAGVIHEVDQPVRDRGADDGPSGIGVR